MWLTAKGAPRPGAAPKRVRKAEKRGCWFQRAFLLRAHGRPGRATTVTTALEACRSEPVPRRESSRTGKAYHAAGRTFVVVASLPRRAYHCCRHGRSVPTVNPAWSTPSPGAHGDGSREASHVAVPAVTVVVHRQRVPSSQARRSGPRGMNRPDAAPTPPSSR